MLRHMRRWTCKPEVNLGVAAWPRPHIFWPATCGLLLFLVFLTNSRTGHCSSQRSCYIAPRYLLANYSGVSFTMNTLLRRAENDTCGCEKGLDYECTFQADPDIVSPPRDRPFLVFRHADENTLQAGIGVRNSFKADIAVQFVARWY